MAQTITLSTLRVLFPAQTGPDAARRDHKASSRGQGISAPEQNLLPPDEAWVGGAIPPGPAWAGKRARSGVSRLKVMVWDTYCINQSVGRRFGKLMSRPFE